jgi:hypothetical protein
MTTLSHFRPHPALSGEILLMAVIPHPPHSPNLAPCDFFIFSKTELKMRGHRVDTTEEIQAESQSVLDTLTEKDFQEAFQNGGEGGTGVYMREGTTSRVMAADRPYGESGIFWIHLSYISFR